MPDTAAVSSMLDRVADDLLTEQQAAELLGWTYSRLKMRRLRADAVERDDPDFAPAHVLAGGRPLYLRNEIERWQAAHADLFDTEPMLDVYEIAEETGIPLRTLRDLRLKQKNDPSSDAHPPWIIDGSKLYVRSRDLEAWVKRRLRRQLRAEAPKPRRDPAKPKRSAKASTRKRAKRRD